MNILVLGGTGAMGLPLVQKLSLSNEVWVTSGSDRESIGNVHYLKGNACDNRFLSDTLSLMQWDAIVDFMVRGFDEFSSCVSMLLNSTKQYVFISSARVYAKCDSRITEKTPRLLDVSNDSEFLKTNEYSLEKAREEDLLKVSGSNYTIIRPSITYNNYRLQLGAFEKEEWLFRAMQGKTIVFSNDMRDKLTTLTCGSDVANGIVSIIGKEQAIGETFHITSPNALTWDAILSVYVETLTKYYGKDINVVYTDQSTCFSIPGEKYRLKYCKLFNRSFDTRKINKFINTSNFLTPVEGLSECLINFLQKPKFGGINWKLEGIHDRITHEYTPVSKITGINNKVIYLEERYNLMMVKALKRILKTIINR